MNPTKQEVERAREWVKKELNKYVLGEYVYEGTKSGTTLRIILHILKEHEGLKADIDVWKQIATEALGEVDRLKQKLEKAKNNIKCKKIALSFLHEKLAKYEKEDK